MSIDPDLDLSETVREAFGPQASFEYNEAATKPFTISFGSLTASGLTFNATFALMSKMITLAGKSTCAVDQQHAEMVSKLMKPGAQIKEEVTPDQFDLIHSVMGICGEAGELLDAVKKAAIYQKPIDRENVIEELGDLEFYLQNLRARLGIKREVTLFHNISKLAKRYAGHEFTNKAAIERADKQGEPRL